LGNICRSPLAEAIIRSKLIDKIADLEVDSAGTGAWHVGEAPDFRSVIVAAKNGLDIAGLKGRQFQVSDFAYFDYIFAMDKSNLKHLTELAPTKDDLRKLHLFLEYAEHQSLTEVPDPYFGDAMAFDQVFRLLDTAAERVADKILTERQP
jgi:protein-tyrosine phosphatase